MSFISQQNSINNHTFNHPISINDFEIIKELGNGAFGYVYKSKYKNTGMIYAVKYIKQSEFKKQGKELDFKREKAILYDLTKRGYPHTVKLYADFEDDNFRYLVMEFLEGTYLNELQGTFQNNGYVDQQLVINILTQLLEILKYLHDTCHIMHRDIKPDNIILESNGNIKVFDFGLSAYLENKANPDPQLISNRSLKGHKQFTPNEIIFYDIPLDYDYKIDVFALGFVMFSVMNKSKGKKYILPEITEGSYGNMRRFKNNVINTFYDSWLMEFLSILYENDKMARPTSANALDLFNKLLVGSNKAAIINNFKINRNKEISNVNILFRRDSYNQQPSDNPLINSTNNNQINDDNPNTMTKSSTINNNINNINNISDPNINTFFNNMDSGISEAEEFLRPNMGKENRIKSSMKCLLYILYKLDIMNFIRSQLNQLFNNCQMNYQQLFMLSFCQMMNLLMQLENNQIDINNYNQAINNFMQQILNNNSDNNNLSQPRPIMIFYMISSIFKKEIQQYFNNCYQNNIFDNIIQNNFGDFNCIIPINNPNVYNSVSQKILTFKNQYKSPFVDNFYFLILNISKCPQCGNPFGIHDYHIAQFLQLDVPNPNNTINELINNYFNPNNEIGNYYCQNCSCQGKKMIVKYCLNAPNYLVMEFEDKNRINFSDKIGFTLYNGQNCCYQYYASIYKHKVNNGISYCAIIKMGNAYYLYSNDSVNQCSEQNINSDCPSLAIYKRIS